MKNNQIQPLSPLILNSELSPLIKSDIEQGPNSKNENYKVVIINEDEEHMPEKELFIKSKKKNLSSSVKDLSISNSNQINNELDKKSISSHNKINEELRFEESKEENQMDNNEIEKYLSEIAQKNNYETEKNEEKKIKKKKKSSKNRVYPDNIKESPKKVRTKDPNENEHLNIITKNDPISISPSPTTGASKKSLYSPVLKNKRILKADQINLKELDNRMFEPNVMELEKELSKSHARDSNNMPYSCEKSCCIHTGNYFCLSTNQNSEIDKFGIGVTLYYKFLKFIITFFVFFCILSTPSIVFSLLATKNTDLKFDSFTKYLFGTTLGSIGYSNYICSQSDPSIKANIFQPKNKILNLKCLTGTIDIRDSTSKFGLNLITNSSINLGCRGVNEDDLDFECLNDDKIKVALSRDCNETEFCSFDIKTEFFQPNCQKNLTNYNFFISALCKDTTINFLSNSIPVSTSLVAIIIGECDTLISLSFFIMLLLLQKSQKKTVRNLLSESLTPSHFSIEVTDLPNSEEKEEMMMNLKSHFEKFMEEKKNQMVEIIDIHVSEGGNEIQNLINKEKLSKKRNLLVGKLVKNYLSNTITPLPESVDFEKLEKFVDKINDKKIYDKSSKILKKIERIESKIIDLQNNLYTTNIKNTKNQVCWMTFDRIPQRDLVYNDFSTSLLERCCMGCLLSCCVSDERRYENKYLIINNAPDPSNINWANMNSGFCNLFSRRFISILVTLLLIFICFIGIAFIKLQKDDYLEKHPPVNCDNFKNINEIDVANEYKSNQKLGYIECYCNDDFTKKINKKFKDADNTQICLLWLNEYFLNQALPYILVFFIIFINIIMQEIFIVLSSFEKHKYVSVEMGARVLKIFIGQFLNTGMLLLIVNIKFKYDSNSSIVSGIKIIVNGKFGDLTPDWFNDVGSVIALTLIANVCTSPVTYILYYAIKKIKILWDQRCRCEKSISRKKSATSYYNLYKGPQFMIDFRYAQIVSIIYVCMIYGGGIPVLYVSTCLQLFIFYWFDKIFLFKFYRKPKNFDEKLESYVIKLLFISLLFHIGFSVWIFGNEKIFNDTYIVSFINDYVNIAEQQIGDNLKADFTLSAQKRILKTQCLTLDILFLLLILYFIYRIILVYLFRKITYLVKKYDTQDTPNPTNEELINSNYFQVLTTDQIKKEIIYTDLTIDGRKKLINPLYLEFLNNRKEKLIEQLDNPENIHHFIDLHSYDHRNFPGFNDLIDFERKEFNDSN